MLKLNHLSDKNLQQNLLNLRGHEKSVVAEILLHLQEVSRRRMFCDYQCESMHAYCVKILGYSDGEAWIRIKAAKLIKQRPELVESIKDGRLNLTNASNMMHLFDKGQFDGSEKNKIINNILGQSTREAKIILEQVALENGVQEKENLSSMRRRKIGYADKTELKIVLGNDDLENLNFIKSKLNIKDDGDLLKKLLKRERARLDPACTMVKARSEKNALEKNVPSKMTETKIAQSPVMTEKTKAKKNFTTPRNLGAKVEGHPRSISPAKKFKIYADSHSQCEKCQSVFALNIDHIKPVAHGGNNAQENLRLLCRNCNQREAILKMGVDFMANKRTKTSS